jgi:hypothetical protein
MAGAGLCAKVAQIQLLYGTTGRTARGRRVRRSCPSRFRLWGWWFGGPVLRQADRRFHGLRDPVPDRFIEISARRAGAAGHQFAQRIENPAADLVQELLFRDAPGDLNLIGRFAPAFSFQLSKTVNTP